MVTFDEAQLQKFKALAGEYGLQLLILFGSQVTGRTHAESDYDVGYLADRKFTMYEEGEIIIRLTGIFRLRDERLINLVNLRRVKPLLLFGATKSAQILFQEKPTTFARLRAYAYRQYIETKPLYRLKAQRLGIRPS